MENPNFPGTFGELTSKAMSDKMKAVRVLSEKEFERLLDHLAQETHQASDHWHQFKGLQAARKKYAREMHESLAFWNFTILANYDTVLFRLARLYDQHDCGLGLKRFLLTVKASAEFFSQDARRLRLRKNPFIEGLLARKLNPATLGGDLRRVSEDDALVFQLCKLRNQALSHVEPNPVRLGTTPTLPWLESPQIETLLRRARQIINRYSSIYRASSFSMKVLGADDYMTVLSLVRKGRNTVIAERKLEIQHITRQGRRTPRPKPHR